MPVSIGTRCSPRMPCRVCRVRFGLPSFVRSLPYMKTRSPRVIGSVPADLIKPWTAVVIIIFGLPAGPCLCSPVSPYRIKSSVMFTLCYHLVTGESNKICRVVRVFVRFQRDIAPLIDPETAKALAAACSMPMSPAPASAPTRYDPCLGAIVDGLFTPTPAVGHGWYDPECRDAGSRGVPKGAPFLITLSPGSYSY